jgi:hypothetical protein
LIFFIAVNVVHVLKLADEECSFDLIKCELRYTPNVHHGLGMLALFYSYEFFKNVCSVIYFGILCFVSAYVRVTMQSCLHPLLCAFRLLYALFIMTVHFEIMDVSLVWKMS